MSSTMDASLPADPVSTAPVPGDIVTSHKVLVGIVIMIVVLAVLVEGAGESHEWAIGIGLLLLCPLLLEGINNSSKFSSWVANNPIQKGLS